MERKYAKKISTRFSTDCYIEGMTITTSLHLFPYLTHFNWDLELLSSLNLIFGRVQRNASRMLVSRCWEWSSRPMSRTLFLLSQAGEQYLENELLFGRSRCSSGTLRHDLAPTDFLWAPIDPQSPWRVWRGWGFMMPLSEWFAPGRLPNGYKRPVRSTLKSLTISCSITPTSPQNVQARGNFYFFF